jgi:hypothetical protein
VITSVGLCLFTDYLMHPYVQLYATCMFLSFGTLVIADALVLSPAVLMAYVVSAKGHDLTDLTGRLLTVRHEVRPVTGSPAFTRMVHMHARDHTVVRCGPSEGNAASAHGLACPPVLCAHSCSTG